MRFCPWILALVLAASACHRDEGAGPTAAPGDTGPAAVVRDICPVRVAGTSVAVTNTGTDVTMHFIATTSGVVEVRRRVERLAELRNIEPSIGGGDPPMADELEPRRPRGGPLARGIPHMVPSEARAEVASDGARLILTPNDPFEIDELLRYVRALGDRMRLGQCPNDFLMPEMPPEPALPSLDRDGAL